MSSRILSSPKHVFECFLEVAGPQSDSQVSQPWILQSYPPSYKDKEVDRLKSVPQFTFPCPINITQVEHFSFVLTNLEAQWTFGFCRYAPNSETALCILSSLPWHELFYKMLNSCAELLHSDQLTTFLKSVHCARIPLPGLVFHVQWDQNIFTSPTPSSFHLPSIPENRNLTEYFNAVDSNTMLIIFASMLYERRILITSRKLSRLSACVQAANTLIYPMFWQHIFIPVLPAQLMDYLSAPMPFLIGVPELLMKRIRRSELGDVVILDADNNRVETPFEDLESFPTEVLSNLRKSLKPGSGLLGDSVARAFLQSLVHLIGGYRDAMRYRQGEKITFSEDAFIMSRSASLQPFLEQMLQLQIFRQFIDERLELLNSGKGFSDEFELECVAFTEKSEKKFKSITHNVKKEVAALAKDVKDKANPAMRQAVKSVRDGGKMARSKAKASYKDVKSKFKENKDELNDDSSSTQSAPSSPTTSRSATLPHSNPPPLTRNNTDLNFGRVLKYERFDPPDERKEQSPEFEEMPRLEYNLMSELDEIMMRNKSNSVSSVEKRVGLADMSTLSTPSRKTSTINNERKSSVGDLISLDTRQEQQVVFDPLLDLQRQNYNPHRRLERTSNPSTGKYENYKAPAGSSQPQFKQFLATMTDQQGRQENMHQAGQARISSNHTIKSSDDLLREYGLNFNTVSISSNQPKQPYPAPRQSVQHSVNIPAPTIPPRTVNTSFLYNSGASLIPAQSSNSTLPVNSRISLLSANQTPAQPLPSCKDILAELDPLRMRTGQEVNGLPGDRRREVVGGLQPLQPPTVPPRNKKQWTTFD